MAEALGPRYCRSWAADQHLPELGGMTVEQALAAGTPTRDVWRAVCANHVVPAHLS